MPSVSTHPLRRICLLLIILGLLAAGATLARRVRVEMSARAVEVVLDYHEAAWLAAQAGMPVEHALARLQRAGATGVALPEETLASLEDEGRVTLVGRGDPGVWSRIWFLSIWDPADPVLGIQVSDPGLREQVVRGLGRAYAQKNLITRSPEWIIMRGSREAVSEIGLGLDDSKVKAITAARLRVMPRLSGNVGLDSKGIKESLAAVADALPAPREGRPRGIIIFDGDTITGYRRLLPDLANALDAHGLVYGAVEFARQKGDTELSRALKGRLLRVHSISTEEMATMPPSQAVDRFGLGVKDRNIRVLYVHLPPVASDSPLESAGRYIHDLASSIRRGGFAVSVGSPAHPFPPLPRPPLLALLFAAGGAGALLWLLTLAPASLPGAEASCGYALAGLGVLAAAALALGAPDLGRIFFGLLAAISFPLLALTWAYQRAGQLAHAPPRREYAAGVAALAVTTAITMAGALLIAAMLSESPFLVKVQQFVGVKLALAAPLLLLAALVATDGVARAGEGLDDYGARVRASLRTFLAQPVAIGGIVLCVAILVALALLMVRSGNEGNVAVSGAELHFRYLLDNLLIARPRTKEFACGHPMLIMAMVAAGRGRRSLAMLLLLGGAVGQVTVLNTYCHAHTPLLISLLRTFHGLWLGALIGGILLLIFARRAPKEPAGAAVAPARAPAPKQPEPPFEELAE